MGEISDTSERPPLTILQADITPQLVDAISPALLEEAADVLTQNATGGQSTS